MRKSSGWINGAICFLPSGDRGNVGNQWSKRKTTEMPTHSPSEFNLVPRRKLKLVVAYDGTDFQGWQVQANGPSIQSALGDAIEKVTGHRHLPIGSGRTDSGVHALAQVCHFSTDSQLPTWTLQKALNHHLPRSIVVKSVDDAPRTFHARKDAVKKLYRYIFHDGPVPDVFTRPFAWHVRYRLDISLMSESARALVGTHDFRSFETDWPNRKSSVRTITRCDVSRLADYVLIDVESDGFLYNMVRAIAGSLYEVGRSKWPTTRLREALEAGDRQLAGQTAPAQGLFLVRVTYPTSAQPEGEAPPDVASFPIDPNGDLDGIGPPLAPPQEAP
jgi:tRNA pseudouridine38-40 synthase